MTLFKFLSTLSALLFLADVPCSAQIEQPHLGYMLDSGHALRPVAGIAPSASMGNPELVGVNSFGCSATLCVATSDDSVSAFVPQILNLLPDNTLITPCVCKGPALVAVDPANIADRGAWIYLQATRKFARWHDGTLQFIDSSPDGEIVSMRATADGFDYAIVRQASRRSESTTWIEHYSANEGSVSLVGSVDGAAAVMLLDGGVLISSGDHVIVRRPGLPDKTFSLNDAQTFHAAGDGYVEIVAPGARWLLRTDPGREELNLLPAVSAGPSPHGRRGPARRSSPDANPGFTTQ